jgi:hypothetical protein
MNKLIKRYGKGFPNVGRGISWVFFLRNILIHACACLKTERANTTFRNNVQCTFIISLFDMRKTLIFDWAKRNSTGIGDGHEDCECVDE